MERVKRVTVFYDPENGFLGPYGDEACEMLKAVGFSVFRFPVESMYSVEAKASIDGKYHFLDGLQRIKGFADRIAKEDLLAVLTNRIQAPTSDVGGTKGGELY